MTAPTPQRCLVTGAGSGIGRALALALAQGGADVLLVGRRPATLAAVARAGAVAGGRLLPCPSDLTRRGSATALAARVAGELGGLDLLVHAAGLFVQGSIAQTSAADLDRLLAIHVRAPFLLTRALLPELRRSRGEVVFVISSAIQMPRAGVGPYTASKLALKGLADCLRQEENERGVRVLSVHPGRTASPMQEEIHRLEGRPYHPERLLQPEDVARAVLDAIALPRTAEVTDLHLRPFRKG